MGVGNGSVPGLPRAPSERPSTRAALVHIRLDFWVNYNPSATFGEDECCWQGAAFDFPAQSPAEPFGIARRRGTHWFRVAQQDEGPCSGTAVALESLYLIC